MVDEALAETPKSVSLYGKAPQRAIHLPRQDGGFIMRTGTGAHGYVDPASGNYRNLDLQAVKEIGAVASGLDQVGFVAHPFVAGVPEITADIHSLATMINHTDKHCWVQPYSKESIEYLMKIAVVAAGGEGALRARPLASCITCSFTPLEFKHMDTEAILQAGGHGLPVHACSLPSAGGTAPLSTAGLVLMAAAEILAMVTIAHVLVPGTVVIATPLMFSLDMRTGSALQSSPETLQAVSMAVQGDEARFRPGDAFLRRRLGHTGYRHAVDGREQPADENDSFGRCGYSGRGWGSWNAPPCKARCRPCWTMRWVRCCASSFSRPRSPTLR